MAPVRVPGARQPVLLHAGRRAERHLGDGTGAMTASDHLVAALAGRYAVERELGHGGMATVHLARDVKHGRTVAIKVLRPDLAQAVGSERFLREINIAAQLQSPHILPMLESGEADGLLYYVMPYVQGDSLRDRLV